MTLRQYKSIILDVFEKTFEYWKFQVRVLCLRKYDSDKE